MARAARWAAELFTVFVGVYAAFLLNNYQSHRQEQQRREQILAWMERDYTESLASARAERENIRRQAAAFHGKLDAGEMPPLSALSWRSDYDPSDVATVLGGGGFDLLEVETVREIRDCEDTLRLMLTGIRHDQQLSDTYLLPNLDKDRSVFYDPATRRLRPEYRWYADFFAETLQGYDTLLPKLEKLLAQIRAERRRDR